MEILTKNESLPKKFTITAHAGSLNTKPNTCESLKICLDFMGDDGCVEVDVRFNSKGEPILSHNPPLPGENPAKLEEFFSLLQNYKTHVNLDIKETKNLPEIQRLAEEYGVLRQVFFTGVYTFWAKTVRENAPKIPYYINNTFFRFRLASKNKLQKTADYIKSLGGVGLNTRHICVTRRAAEIMHENGLLISLFTVDKKSHMRRALSLSADNITSRKPDVLKKLISEIAG